MADRNYPSSVMNAWGKQIERAEAMVADATVNPSKFDDGSYKVELDPEDFLDLLCGKWHIKQVAYHHD